MSTSLHDATEQDEGSRSDGQGAEEEKARTMAWDGHGGVRALVPVGTGIVAVAR
jgi:hypothetical protein